MTRTYTSAVYLIHDMEEEEEEEEEEAECFIQVADWKCYMFCLHRFFLRQFVCIFWYEVTNGQVSRSCN